MELCAPLKKRYAQVECWTVRDSATGSAAWHSRALSFKSRFRVQPLWTWQSSWQDHAELALWPAESRLTLHGRLLGYWAALTLRPEVQQVTIRQTRPPNASLHLKTWQNYVLLLDLRAGPAAVPGPHSCRFGSLHELAAQHQHLAALGEFVGQEPATWQVWVALAGGPQTLLNWTQLLG